MSLRADIRHRLDYLLIPDRLKRIDALKLKIEELERERSEVRQWIPLWDRVKFFSQVPDEAREGEITLKLEPSRTVLVQLREEVALTLERVGREFPPFAIGAQIERSFQLAHGQNATDVGPLQAVLEALAARILEVWVPDFDAAALFDALSVPSRCQRAAERGVAPATDDRLGVAPLAKGELISVVAKRLSEGDFFKEQLRLSALEERRIQLASAHEKAAKSVSLLDTVNVFSGSKAEEARDAIRRDLEETEKQLTRCYETTRQLLHRALGAYPPLAIYQRAVEVLGVLGQLDPAREPNLDASGRVTRQAVVSGRALVFAGLRRLLSTFLEVFPDVPIPLTVAQELTDGSARRTLSPRALLIREFHKRLEGSWGRGVCEEALAHAAMQGALAQRLKKLRTQIGLLDRIIFFVNSAKEKEKEKEKEELERRASWHRREADRLWDELLRSARGIGGQLAPFAVRDVAIRVTREIDALSTELGSSKAPKECSVLGCDEAIASMVEIRDILRDRYMLEGTRAEMMARVAETPDADGDEDERRRFEPLAHAEVLRRLARRLQGTAFSESFRSLEPHKDEFARLSFTDQDLGDQITLWDKINAFTTTPEGTKREELHADLSKLDTEIQTALTTVDALFQQALADVYPPAILYYSIGGVISALRAIRAECRPRSVSTGSGRHARKETSYTCDLAGKDTALAALRVWRANLARTYGELPGYHELLEHCQLDGIVEAGWDFDPH
jgi:hypothetical protein